MTNTTVQRAVIYTRVSTEEQAESGTSLDTQLENCERYAKSRGWEVVAVCSDEGVSGAKYKTRPGIQKSLSLIEKGAAQILLAYHLDRVGRTTCGVLDIAQRIDDAGGQLCTCQGQEFGGTAAGKFMLGQFALLAEFERNTIRERSVMASQKRAKEGIQVARNIAPYGYHIITKEDFLADRYPGYKAGDYYVIEEQAKWVREMFAMYAAGESLRGVARRLNESGAPLKKGIRKRKYERWQMTSVKTILTNPVYKGEAGYGRRKSIYNRATEKTHGVNAKPGEFVTIPCTPLVDAEVWEVVQGRRDRNKELLSGSTDRKYLLSGVLRCPSCGGGMTGVGNQHPHRRYYLCRSAQQGRSVKGDSCTNRAHYHIEKTEAQVIAALVRLLREPQWFHSAVAAYRDEKNTAQPAADSKETLCAELAQIEAREVKTARAQVDALMAERDTGAYDTLLAELSTRKRELKARIAAVDDTETGEFAFDAENIAQQYTAVMEALEEMLTSAEVPVSDRHRALTSLVSEITPISYNLFGEEVETFCIGQNGDPITRDDAEEEFHHRLEEEARQKIAQEKVLRIDTVQYTSP